MYDIQHGPQSTDPDQRSKSAITGNPRFVIGRGRRGGWIVNDRLGHIGGIFVSEAAARHFTFEESGGHPEDTVILSGKDLLELDLLKAA